MSPVHPAPAQLADLAAVMRPDWDQDRLKGAISGARSSGWSWPRVFIEVARLLVQEDSSPADLTNAARSPLELAHRPAAPEVAAGWAADIRELLARRAS